MEFLQSVVALRCGLSTVYKVPYVVAEQVPAILAFLEYEGIDDFVLIRYLEICATGTTVGVFPDEGIKIGPIYVPKVPPTENFTSANQLGLVLSAERIVSTRVFPRYLHQHPILNRAVIACEYWTDRLWNPHGSNEWVDHDHVAKICFEILLERGLRMESSFNEFDRFKNVKHLLLMCPKMIDISYDMEAVKYMRETIPGKGYIDNEVSPRYRTGLTRSYRTNTEGVGKMIQDFETGDFGLAEPLDASEALLTLTVCILQEICCYMELKNDEVPSLDNGLPVVFLEQLSIFMLSLPRFFTKIRFWCDVTYKSRERPREIWDTLLVPFMIWPTLNISGLVHKCHNESKNLTTQLRKFCSLHGRGGYTTSVTSHRNKSLYDSNSGEEKDSSMPPTYQNDSGGNDRGLVSGRHRGVHETAYLLVRAMRYKMFANYNESETRSMGGFNQWAKKKERELTKVVNFSLQSPWMFSDLLARQFPPAQTMVTLPRHINVEVGFEGIKTLIPEGATDEEAPLLSILANDRLFVYCIVGSYEVDAERSIQYTVLSRLPSGLHNCWLCEVGFGKGYNKNGHLLKIVHYVSACGAATDGTMPVEHEWLEEVSHIMGTLQPDYGKRSKLIRTAIRWNEGLPSWDGWCRSTSDLPTTN